MIVTCKWNLDTRSFFLMSPNNMFSKESHICASSSSFQTGMISEFGCLCVTCYKLSPTGPGFPGLPADLQAARIKETTSSTPLPSLTLVKMVGPSPRISLESRSITSSDAPTYGAKSICRCEDQRSSGTQCIGLTLLTINRSDCEIPGPPFRGILSPP